MDDKLFNCITSDEHYVTSSGVARVCGARGQTSGEDVRHIGILLLVSISTYWSSWVWSKKLKIQIF